MSFKTRVKDLFVNIYESYSTGFMGKVLVEKLLRDCEGISKIYILVRPKKGLQPNQRRSEYLKHEIFERIREKNIKQLEKISVVKGDVAVDGLDLDENDENELIDNVNLIFNCAANVRFDQDLKNAVNFNTNGTLRVLQLAEKMKGLVVFTHVSTAYCQCTEEVLEEKYYPANENPFGVMKMVKLLNDDTLKTITTKLLNGLPNTYAYTKSLSEDLVHSYAGKFPIVIARPSVVTAALKEPFAGWIEGLNGPTGLMIGAGKGVVRSMHCNPDFNSDTVPVDITINAIIALTYQRSKMDKGICSFFNLTNSGIVPLTWGELIEMGRKLFNEYPMVQCLWYPNGSVKKNYYHHMFCVIFFHYLPAYFIDFLMIIFRQQPLWVQSVKEVTGPINLFFISSLVNIQKRVSLGLNVLQYYTTRDWIFKNENFLAVHRNLSEVDKEKFFCDLSKVDPKEYLVNYILGTRHFLLKEKPETLPKARATLKR